MQTPTAGSDVDLMRRNRQQRRKEHLAKAHKSQAVDKEMPVTSNTTPPSNVDSLPVATDDTPDSDGSLAPTSPADGSSDHMNTDPSMEASTGADS